MKRANYTPVVKTIITPEVREEAECSCDITGKPAVATLVSPFGYGSRHDIHVLEVDLSDEAAVEILKFLQWKDPHIQLRHHGFVRRPCPFCGRH